MIYFKLIYQQRGCFIKIQFNLYKTAFFMEMEINMSVTVRRLFRDMKKEYRINMIEYTKKLKEKNCSCLIFNIGPYIKEIPQNVIEYCNNNNMPLFTAPWDVKLVNLTRSLCQILQNLTAQKIWSL